MATSSPHDPDILAPNHPQITVGVAGSLHGVHGIAVVSRHAFRPALRVRAYHEISVGRGVAVLARITREAVHRALALTKSVELVVDVTAAGAGLVQDVRQTIHLPTYVSVGGLVVGGGQVEPGGAGRWQGATASRAEMIYAVQQLLAAGQVRPVDDFDDRLSLFRRRHETASAADETAWNEDTADVPGVAFCAAISRWTHWRQTDCTRFEHGERERLMADHPACRNRSGSQQACCCRFCATCGGKWRVPPPGLRRDPGFCSFCVEAGLAPPEGNMSVQVPTGVIPRRRRFPTGDIAGGLLQGSINELSEAVRRERFGGPRMGHPQISRFNDDWR